MYNTKETERHLLCCCVTLWALVSFCEKPNSPICNLLKWILLGTCVRLGGLMVSALDSGFELWPGTLCCVLGQDTLLSQCLSPPRCIKIGTGEFSAGGNPAMEQHLIQGGVEILSVASCYRNRNKLQPDGPLGSNTDLTFSEHTWFPHCLKSPHL